MVMVKLKMKTIYKSFLTFIGFLIITAIVIGVLYLFYDKVAGLDSDIEVAGNLSINYVDGKKFDVDNKTIIKFSVTNDSEEVNYFNVVFSQVRGNGTFKLWQNENIIKEGDLKSIDEITTDFMSVDSNETKLYTLEIINTSTEHLKGALNIRTHEAKTKTFADKILENAIPSISPLTEVGVEIAIDDEGLIKSSDDIGVSYYFRGNVTNNFVSFADMIWRIVRINGDGTVRMILDGTTETISNYYANDNVVFNFEKSTMNNFLESWLNDNLNDYLDYIVNTKYCNDINHDENYSYNAYARIMTNKIPALNCLGDSFNNNIGLMTIDEVIFAGATPGLNNQDYYLYNPNIKEAWYTMTGASGTDTSINMFMVDGNGGLKTNVAGNLYRNVRPVINLIKNIEMEGDGTKENPYHIKK